MLIAHKNPVYECSCVLFSISLSVMGQNKYQGQLNFKRDCTFLFHSKNSYCKRKSYYTGKIRSCLHIMKMFLVSVTTFHSASSFFYC